MTNNNDTKYKKIENINLDTLEKVSGGQFLTRKDQIAAYNYVMTPKCDPQEDDMMKWFYTLEMTNPNRKVTFDEWWLDLIDFMECYNDNKG